MAQLPLPAMAWIAGHHGIVDRGRLLRLGVSDGQIDRRLQSGRLVPVHHGVYRSADWPETELGRCVAACRAAPSGAISHRTAARLWGLRRCAGEDIEICVPSRNRVRTPGIVVHRTTVLRPNDIVRRSDGIRLTSPLRTACDLGTELGEEDLASVIEQVLDQYRVRYRTLRISAEQLLRRGWRGGPRLRAVLDGRPAGAAPHDSHLEVRVGRALVRAGLPPPVRQLPIEILPGIEVHADLGFPEARLAVEVDHRTWHSGSQAALDKRRDRQVRLAGYETVRVTDTDLRHRFDETIAELTGIYRVVARRTAG